MIRIPTLLVLGAGASQPYGFPIQDLEAIDDKKIEQPETIKWKPDQIHKTNQP